MKKPLIFLFITIFALQGCTVLDQMSQMQTLAKCDFEFIEADQITIAGVSMDDKKQWSDFSFQETLQLTMTLAKNEIPTSFVVHLMAENPNKNTAGMNRLNWELFIDEESITAGILEESFTIPPNGGTTMIPLEISFDLRKLFSGSSGRAMMNLVSNLQGKGQDPSKLAMKLVPTIRVGEKMIQYPGAVTVRHQVGK